MLDALLICAMLLFAAQAIRARRLIASALWLAGVSALLSIIFYSLGAPWVAVIELSVGAGLVTILFVFAISIAGEADLNARSLLPWFLAGGLVIAMLALLGWLILPAGPPAPSAGTSSLPTVLWQERGLDVLVQMVLIFSGVLGLLGLLAEVKAPLEKSVAEEVAAQRDRELLALQQSLPKEEEA